MKTTLAKLFSWTSSSDAKPAKVSGKRSLRLEPLEDRQMLAVSAADFAFDAIFPFEGTTPEKIVVSSLLDENDGDYSDGNLSLREAIDLANLNDGYTEISFADQLFDNGGSIVLTMGTLLVTNSQLSLIGGGLSIIDGDDLSSVFTVFDSTVYISGATITGGNASFGGGIFGINSDFYLDEVNIAGNHAVSSGGGVYLAGGSLTASHLWVDQNTAGLNGGGMYLGNVTVGLVDTTISNNESGKEGGGIYQQNGQFYMLASTLSDNTAHTNGGGYLSHKGNVRIEKSHFIGNHAGGNGGGFYHDGGAHSSVTLSNSIADFNTAGLLDLSGNPDAKGGAFYLACDAELVNMTITQNSVGASMAGGGIFAIAAEGYVTKLYNSIVSSNFDVPEENQEGTPGRDLAGTITGTHNLIGHGTGFEWLGEETNIYSANPKFVSFDQRDYRLQSDSPAIDAGNNLYVQGDSDYMDNARISLETVDLGAYEFVYNEWIGSESGSWFEKENWSTGHVPNSQDKVFIPENVEVEVSQYDRNLSIDFAELICRGNLRINASLSDLTLDGYIDVSGSITLENGNLNFAGGGNITGPLTAAEGTQIKVSIVPVTISGVTSLDGVSLFVENTTLSLPNLESYTRNSGDATTYFKVSGPNGLLDVPALISFTNNLQRSQHHINLSDGGQINIPNFDVITKASVFLNNTSLDLSSVSGNTLTNLDLYFENGSSILGMDAITHLDSCLIAILADNAVFSFSSIVSAENTQFQSSHNSTLSLPNLERYILSAQSQIASVAGNNIFYVNNAIIDAPLLAEIIINPIEEGTALTVEMHAENGGRINLAGLITIDGDAIFTADNGIIDVSNLPDRIDFTIMEINNGQVLLKKYIPEQLIVSTLTDENDGRYFEGGLSLREAIELAAARDGNTIITFSENVTGTISLLLGELVIEDALITIIAPGITIDGGQISRVFNITDSTVTLTGMTIVNGYTEEDGGGILALDSNLKLKQVVIVDCMANSNQSRGGGIYFLGITQSTMTDVLLRNNQAASGGGIGYYFDGSLTLTNVIVSGNLAQQGGGIYAFGSNADTAVITLNNVSVIGNTAFQTNYTGGGIFARNVRLDISNSRITDNTAYNGAGITLLGGAVLTMNNSLIANNAAQYYAGGIYLGALENLPVHATLNNVTVTDNSGHLGAAGIFLQDYYGDSTLTLNNTIVAGNTGATGLDLVGDVSGTNNLIGGDPLFVNVAERDYRLAIGSPGIDAGNNAFVGENAVDLNDNNRIMNGTVDIGAYENLAYGSLVLDAEVSFTVLEGGEIRFTLTRSDRNDYDLTVRFVNSDADAFVLPEFVVIPAGETSVTFTGTAVRDYLYTEEDKIVTITISCPGFTPDAYEVTIGNIDVEDPSSVMETINMPESEAANWTVRQNGTLIEIVDDAGEVVFSQDSRAFGILQIVASDDAESTLTIDYSSAELLNLNIEFVGSEETGNTLVILGTEEDDTFRIATDSLEMNGSALHLSWTNVETVNIVAGEGNDTFVFDAEAENTAFTFKNGIGSLVADGTTWQIQEAETFSIKAGNVKSTAQIRDTQYADTFRLESQSARMTGGIYDVNLNGFQQVDIMSFSGGSDIAIVTAENSAIVIMNDTYTERREADQFYRVWYVSRVTAINGDDSGNMLIHQGSKGTDIYNWSESYGTATNSAGKYFHEMSGFNKVDIQVVQQSAIVKLPEATEETQWIEQEQKKLWISDNLNLGIYGNATILNPPTSIDPETEPEIEPEVDPEPAALPFAVDDMLYKQLAADILAQNKTANQKDDWSIDWSEQALLDLMYGDL